MSKRKLTFTGTHEEIGKQIGIQYKNWGKKEMYIPPLVDKYYNKQLATYEKYFPQYINYLEGVAKGLNISKDKVFKSYLTGFLDVANNKTPHKCSIFVTKNQEGIVVGRNYDWLESSEKISSLITINFTDNPGSSFTGITDMGTWKYGESVKPYEYELMFDDAWNDKGLYIALNGAPGSKSSTGFCTPHVIQAVVEQCETTDDAVKLLSDIPIDNSKIFTIADKNGNFAVVEKSLKKGTFVRYSKEAIYSTNHYNSPELLSENLLIFQDVPFHSTFARYHYLEYNLLNTKNTITHSSAIELLSKPPIKQNWRGKDNGDTLSIWTYGLNLSTSRYKIVFAPILDSKEVIEG